MTLIIQNQEADELALELARTTGETVPQAVIQALRERLEREKTRQHDPEELAMILLRISQECAALPLQDYRTPDEIVGYDSVGMPA